MRSLPFLLVVVLLAGCERKQPGDFGHRKAKQEGVPRAAPVTPPVSGTGSGS